MKNECPNAAVGGTQAQVPIVIRRGSTQILVEVSVPFPQEFPATEIVQVIKKVRDLNIFVCKNKAVINGVLDVNVIYKTYEGNYSYRRNGNDPEATFGNVKQIGFSTPFSGFVEVPGSNVGDNFIVNFAGVEDQCELDVLEDPIQLQCSVTAYRRIRISTIIKVDVSIVRNVLIPVRHIEEISPVAAEENDNGNHKGCSC